MPRDDCGAVPVSKTSTMRELIEERTAASSYFSFSRARRLLYPPWPITPLCSVMIRNGRSVRCEREGSRWRTRARRCRTVLPSPSRRKNDAAPSGIPSVLFYCWPSDNGLESCAAAEDRCPPAGDDPQVPIVQDPCSVFALWACVGAISFCQSSSSPIAPRLLLIPIYNTAHLHPVLSPRSSCLSPYAIISRPVAPRATPRNKRALRTRRELGTGTESTGRAQGAGRAGRRQRGPGISAHGQRARLFSPRLAAGNARYVVYGPEGLRVNAAS